MLFDDRQMNLDCGTFTFQLWGVLFCTYR